MESTSAAVAAVLDTAAWTRGVVPANVSKECWRFPDRAREPLVERL